MERIKTLETRNLCKSAKKGGAENVKPLASLLVRPAAV